MDRWVGKVAVVTGASAGIGQNLVEKLTEEGLQVVGLARRVERVEETAKKLSGKRGKLHAVKCDVSSEEEVKKAFQWVKDNLGPVSILINNAGVLRVGSLADSEPSSWKQVLDINVFGTALCTQQAIQQMKAANIDGHIINVNSIAGYKVIDTLDNKFSSNVYAPSKHAITAFTEVVRQELKNSGTKIKVTSVSPGVVHTDIFKAGNETEETPEVYKNLPFLEPEDITDAIVYVLGTKPHVQIHELTIKPVGEPF